MIESAHSREEGYAAQFSTHAIVTDRLTVHMENSVFDEASLRDYFARLGEALFQCDTGPRDELREVGANAVDVLLEGLDDRLAVLVEGENAVCGRVGL